MTSMGAGKSSDFHDWRYDTVPPPGFGVRGRRKPMSVAIFF